MKRIQVGFCFVNESIFCYDNPMTNKISVDNKEIDEILSRSIDTIYPKKESLKELLLSGKQISIYVGIDPTADYVHLGHSTNYLILERLHKLGHKIIVLVGDFTAMIGDPSDKTSARVQLSREEINVNLKSFKDQIGKILDFENKENPIEFKFNSEWLSGLSFEKIVELGSNFTVQQMLERDMFEKRIKESKPLFVSEFFYPLLQGYDSVALKVDLEIGGTDQTFNMLAGRTLARRYLDHEKMVMTTTLLVNPVTGEKLMSKSLGTGIGLNESAESMFGKTMAMTDEGVVQTFIDCTRLSLEEIEEKKKRLIAGENPRDIKIELAHEIVKMYHGEEAAVFAEESWKNTFSKKEIPSEVQEIKVDVGALIADVLVANNLVESKSQVRRLLEEGAIKDLEKDEKITDHLFQISAPITLKIGKKIFVKFVV